MCKSINITNSTVLANILYLSRLLEMIGDSRKALGYGDKVERFYKHKKQPLALMTKVVNENSKPKLDSISFHYPHDSQKPQKYKPLDHNFELWAYLNEFRLAN